MPDPEERAVVERYAETREEAGAALESELEELERRIQALRARQSDQHSELGMRELERRFVYQAPSSPGVAATHTEVQARVLDLAIRLDVLLPNGHEKSLVMTKLEEVRMWANAGVARYQVQHPDYEEDAE